MPDFKVGRLYKTRAGVMYECTSVYDDDVIVMETYMYSPTATNHKRVAHCLTEKLDQYIPVTPEELQEYIVDVGKMVEEAETELAMRQMAREGLIDKAAEMWKESGENV